MRRQHGANPTGTNPTNKKQKLGERPVRSVRSMWIGWSAGWSVGRFAGWLLGGNGGGGEEGLPRRHVLGLLVVCDRFGARRLDHLDLDLLTPQKKRRKKEEEKKKKVNNNRPWRQRKLTCAHR